MAAEKLDRPTLVVKALSATTRGVEIAPTSAPARFNLALALESAGARRQARLAWFRYLELEDDPSWIAEVEDRLRRDLGLPIEMERWRRLRVSAERQWIDRAALETPQALIAFLERDGLGALLHDLEGGRAIDLQPFRAAEALERNSQDPFLRDLFDTLRRCDTRCHALARALRSLREAASALDAYQPAVASAHLRNFRALLGEIPPAPTEPLVAWTSYLEALAAYQDGRRVEALEGAGAAATAAQGYGYSSLEGRAARLAATAELDLLRPEAALSWLERAKDRFEQTGERGRQGAIEALLATALTDLGQLENAWHHRLQALRLASRFGDEDRLPMLFGIAALRALDLDQGDAALALLEETFDLWMEKGDAIDRTENLWWRGRIHRARGAEEKALRDVRQARREASRIVHEAARLSCLAGLWQLEGELLLETQAAGALEAFGKALEVAETVDLDYRLAELRRLRSRAATRLGEQDLARDELELALDSLESKRTEIESWIHRVRFFDQARPIFEDLVQLHLGRGETAMALVWANAGRARELRDVWLSKKPDLSTSDPGEVARGEIPADDALVVFEVLEETTVAWRITSGSPEAPQVETFDLGIGRQDLVALIDSWTASARRGSSNSDAARVLFDRVVHPWLPSSDKIQRLVLAPDEALARIPFHALPGPASHALIEDFEILVTPAASLALAGWSSLPWVRPESLLAVAADAPTEGLPHLASARREIEEIGAFYPDAVYLVGSEATPQRFARLAAAHAVVHFAGHARTADRTRQSRLLFGGNDHLEFEDVAGFELGSTRLVILAACDTHHDSQIGLEGPVTLATAFVGLGVSQTLAALWPVEDQGARAFMTSFHRRIAAGERPSQALQGASIEAIRDRESVDSSWRAFQLVGAPFSPG